MHFETTGMKAFKWFNYVFLALLSFVCLYPMLYVLFVAFSDPREYMVHQGALWSPAGFSTASMRAVFGNAQILRGYRNTLWILGLGVPINIFMTLLGAYFLSRKGVMLFRPIMLLIIFTMYFSGGMIPRFRLVSDLGLINSRWAIILPSAISVFNMIILRTAMNSVPASLEESAKIDGASHFRILFKIFLPLVMPTIAVLVLFYGVAFWNMWFDPFLFLGPQANHLVPLQIVLRGILVNNNMDMMVDGVGMDDRALVAVTIQYAIIIVSTVPILMLYPFLQRYFVKGVMVGAVKG